MCSACRVVGFRLGSRVRRLGSRVRRLGVRGWFDCVCSVCRVVGFRLEFRRRLGFRRRPKT